MDLGALERSLRETAAFHRIEQTHFHTVRDENDLCFAVGTDHIRRLFLKHSVAEPDGTIDLIHDLGEMITFETASHRRGHLWVWTENDLIARRVTIFDGPAQKYEQDGTTIEDCAPSLDHLLHAPLGELRSGTEQSQMEPDIMLPRDFPPLARPFADRIHRLWNLRNLAVDDGVRWTGPGGRSGNALDMKQHILGFLGIFPDAVALFERAIVLGDKVALLWRLHAHHQGTSAGLAPTGHRVRLQASTVFTLAGDMVVTEDTVFDEASLRAQLRLPRLKLR